MSGRIAVAPCGHTGETIIGNYVKCLVGCEGKAELSKRGEPGHVVNCACKPCKIRRLARTVVLRTRDGKDIAKAEWDGISETLSIIATADGYIAGYRFLDENGNVVADGAVKNAFGDAVFAGKDEPLTAKTKFMLRDSNMRLSLELVETPRPRRMTFDPSRRMTYDPSKVIVTFKGIELKPYIP